MINLIWAMDKNNLIGKNNRLPWHVKEDLIYYKEITNGKDVLCGRLTYESLKGYYKDKPLPYGKIYVVTNSKVVYDDEKVIIINNVEDFLSNYNEELFVIGGSQIYSIALNYANRLYISIIKGDYEGDTYFPKFSLEEYNLISKKETEQVIYNVYEK